MALTINELAILLERNKHKFVFYSYYGGAGGEFILNYIAENSLNIIPQKHSQLMQDDQWPNIINLSLQNRHYFVDTIFAHYFLISALKSTSEEYTSSSNFKELAERILIGLESYCYGYKEHNFNTLFELDKHEDMRYLVKVHNLYDELKLFKGAKIIRTNPGKWQTHCDMLGFMKNKTLYVHTKDDKKRRIELILARAKENDPMTFVTNSRTPSSKSTNKDMPQLSINKYLANIIENDDIPLYDNTIWMALQPHNYNLDMAVTPAEEINNIETLQKLYFSKFINGDVDASYIEDPVTVDYDITEYDFNEIANGEWITHEFGLDAEEFRNAFDDWYDKNIELLNKLGLTNHYIPKESYIPRN
tara:strand:- start:386 stop:1468 length:1083 start_codon:yes stop_codon:yes gene_type:complete